MIDISTILVIATGIISGASIILKVIVPLTKTKKDDKVLKILLKILEVMSLHTPKDDGKLNINIKNK